MPFGWLLAFSFSFSRIFLLASCPLGLFLKLSSQGQHHFFMLYSVLNFSLMFVLVRAGTMPISSSFLALKPAFNRS